MYPITRKEKLADRIFLMDVKAPRVARYCLPGQFIIAKIDEAGERIPLTICDYDREQGTITIVFQTVGASTERMSWLETGDAFEDFVGPLGQPSELCVEENLEETRKKKIVFIAGGVGTAPVYPQVKCDEVFRKLPEDQVLERVFKANTENLNEYTVASVGITRTEPESESVVRVYMSGLAILMTRVNVIPQNKFIKFEEKDAEKI